MTTPPAEGFFNDGPDTGPAQQALDDMLAVAKELPGGSAVTELTIASGSVTPTGASHTIDTEGDAASDDLTNIALTNHPEGRIVKISPANTNRAVVVKHAAGGDGQVYLIDAIDWSMAATNKALWLERRGTAWYEVFAAGKPQYPTS